MSVVVKRHRRLILISNEEDLTVISHCWDGLHGVNAPWLGQHRISLSDAYPRDARKLVIPHGKTGLIRSAVQICWWGRYAYSVHSARNIKCTSWSGVRLDVQLR